MLRFLLNVVIAFLVSSLDCLVLSSLKLATQFVRTGYQFR